MGLYNTPHGIDDLSHHQGEQDPVKQMYDGQSVFACDYRAGHLNDRGNQQSRRGDHQNVAGHELDVVF